MPESPKISVIIPAYNSEQYLEECIDSAQNQILTDIEIICINDGSTDLTPLLMKKYAASDPRIRVIDKENTGYGHTMNTGIHAALGEYVAILESDDYIEHDMYQILYNTAEENSFPDVVASDMRRFFGQKESRRFEYLEKSQFRAFYEQVFCPSKTPAAFRVNNAMCSGLYRRDFLVENGISYNETPGASFQDNGFFFKVNSLAQSMIFVSAGLYNIRRDNENSSVLSKAKVYCMNEEYDYIRSWVKETSGLDSSLLKICARLRYNAYLFTLNRINEEDKLAFLQKMSDEFKALVELGEANRYYFQPKDWKTIMAIIDNPVDYFFTNYYSKKEGSGPAQKSTAYETKIAELEKKIQLQENRIRQIRSSKTFRIGSALTYVPRKLKRNFKKTKHKEGPRSQVVLVAQNSPHVPTSTKECRDEIIKWYENNTGDELCLDKPQTYNQKIQWLKVYDSTPLKSKLADKIAVREWIAETIGPDYLIPVLGTWNSFDEIDFSSLPEKFVLKANHGSGMNIVVTDAHKFDKASARKAIDKWLKTNYAYRVGLELHYALISPKIYAEQYMSNSQDGLFDYRFYCFNGEPYSIWVDIGSGTKLHRRDVYDLDWNLVPLKVNYPNLEKPLEKPALLGEMLSICKTLSKGFSHVRVDLYVVQEKIYFGEITFTPQSGLGIWDPPEYNLLYGEQIILPGASPFILESGKSEKS